MEPNSRVDLGDKLRRTRTDALKTEVITGMPYEKFVDIQNIYKKLSAKNEAHGEQNQTVHDDRQETGKRRSRRT